jgi:hypothetical protein
MPTKRLAREHEAVEFRPLPGQDDEDWAGTELDSRSPLWKWLGLYPLLAYISVVFTMMGLL